jgi:hypothetical protein
LRSTGLVVPGELFDSSADFSVSEEGAAFFVGRPGRPPKKINELPNFLLISSEGGTIRARPMEISSSVVAHLDTVVGGQLFHGFLEQVRVVDSSVWIKLPTLLCFPRTSSGLMA